MKTVQMTLDEDLLYAVDRVVKKLGTTRSSFTREALRAALKSSRVQALEQKQREGYRYIAFMVVRLGEGLTGS